jgi:hypothetical protein
MAKSSGFHSVDKLGNGTVLAPAVEDHFEGAVSLKRTLTRAVTRT